MKIEFSPTSVECDNSECQWPAEFTISIDNSPKMIFCEHCLETLQVYCNKVLDIVAKDNK